jgi:hypothetical protein
VGVGLGREEDHAIAADLEATATIRQLGTLALADARSGRADVGRCGEVRLLTGHDPLERIGGDDRLRIRSRRRGRAWLRIGSEGRGDRREQERAEQRRGEPSSHESASEIGWTSHGGHPSGAAAAGLMKLGRYRLSSAGDGEPLQSNVANRQHRREVGCCRNATAGGDGTAYVGLRHDV